MSVRFQKRIRILPWVYLNVGKNGVSISLGPRGAKITIGKQGVKGTIGLPGTGIRYETPYYKQNHSSQNEQNIDSPCKKSAAKTSRPQSNLDKLREIKKNYNRK